MLAIHSLLTTPVVKGRSGRASLALKKLGMHIIRHEFDSLFEVTKDILLTKKFLNCDATNKKLIYFLWSYCSLVRRF